jgi:uncharacterized protein
MKPLTWKQRLVFMLRLIVVSALWAYLLLLIGSAYIGAIGLTLPARSSICCQTPADLGLDYKTVQFKTQDGLALKGWYIPSRNGAAVILLHGYGTNRLSMLPHAKMLAESGYGVLSYDQRATGESEGEVRSWGWADIADVGAALEFVQEQPEVQADQVGILGCSIGGQIAIQSALRLPALQAVAADAPTYSQIGDLILPDRLRDWAIWPIHPLLFQFIQWRSGEKSPGPLLEAIPQVSPRPLLIISTGQGQEYFQAQRYYREAVEPKAWLNLPDAAHCTAQLTHPEAYRQAVIRFFDDAFQID